MKRDPRRIVTGHDRDGNSIVTADTRLSPVLIPGATGTAFYEIWNTAASPAPIDNAPDPTGCALRIAPPAAGSIVRFIDFPPEAQQPPPADGEAARAAFAAVGSAGNSTWRPGVPHPYMHRTETVDYGIVVDGEITLVLDDDEVDLVAGDVVVQRGTNHAWSHRSNHPCRMMFVLIDGKYPADTGMAPTPG